MAFGSQKQSIGRTPLMTTLKDCPLSDYVKKKVNLTYSGNTLGYSSIKLSESTDMPEKQRKQIFLQINVT